MMDESHPELSLQTTDRERSLRQSFFQLYQNNPIPPDEQLTNISLFMKRQDLSRLLFKHELYQRILGVHGIVFEFGVRFGQGLVQFQAFRGIHEPFNSNRKIVGFDTFQGFPSVHEKDQTRGHNRVGGFPTTSGYEAFLNNVLAYHEQESPLAHIRKFEVVKGDASVEVVRYLERHPETIVALAYFDLDLYEPTKTCLEAIQGVLTKGSIVAFDELNHQGFPGETLAVKEVWGLGAQRIQRSPLSSSASYVVIE
jgi:hypothetical protein